MSASIKPSVVRVEWYQDRTEETVLIIAEHRSGTWEFSEKPSGEVRNLPLDSSFELIQQARSLLMQVA